MKFLLLKIALFSSIGICAQSDIDTSQSMILMSETYIKSAAIGSQYYQKGETTPYTGILYGRYDNGQLMTVQEYVDGIGNGTWTQYNPDGSKSEQGTYINNKVEGPVTQYYDDGSIKAKGQYLHWKRPIGEWTYYDRSGNVVHRMVYTR